MHTEQNILKRYGGITPFLDPLSTSLKKGSTSWLFYFEEHNIDIDYARKCLEANKHNTVTATYYLIFKKHLKAGGESVADARKKTYNPEVFLKRIPNLKNLLQREKEKS